MKKLIAESIAVLFCGCLLLGCGMTYSARQMSSGSNLVAASGPKQPSDIVVFQEGEEPLKPIVKIANIGAHGNAYAKRNELEQRLRIEAAKIGADCVLVTEMKITKDETVGTYGGGLFISDDIQRPHLYGVAARWATAKLGIGNRNKSDPS